MAPREEQFANFQDFAKTLEGALQNVLARPPQVQVTRGNSTLNSSCLILYPNHIRGVFMESTEAGANYALARSTDNSLDHFLAETTWCPGPPEIFLTDLLAYYVRLEQA